MRKTCLLGVLLLLFAALDMIGIEQILVWEEQLAGQIATRQPDKGQLSSQASNRAVPDNIADAIRADLQIFPIPESTLHPTYTVSYEDSWMTARSFGGERGHEGTDLMLLPD